MLTVYFYLNNDRSIMAISSWNDNGQKQFVHDPCKSVTYNIPTCRPEVFLDEKKLVFAVNPL